MLKFFRGYPHFAPWKYGVLKNEHTFSIAESISTPIQNGSVCKNLDLNILKIDWAMAILSFKKKI